MGIHGGPLAQLEWASFFACAAGLRTLREVIQLHGAIGYTDEHDAGLDLKRALALSAWLGNASAHRARFAALQEQSATP